MYTNVYTCVRIHVCYCYSRSFITLLLYYMYMFCPPILLLLISFYMYMYLLLDTFWLSRENNSVQVDQGNIAWLTDRDVRFRNPPPDQNPYNTSDIVTNNTILPPNWPRLIDHGVRNQSFIVWFRVAAFPNFRKLFGRVPLTNGRLPAGNYTVRVLYSILIIIKALYMYIKFKHEWMCMLHDVHNFVQREISV